VAAISTTSPVVVGGFMIPWGTLRTLLPDTRWALYGVGWVDQPGPAVVASVAYERNNGSPVPFGSQTLVAGKNEIGPYPLRGTFAVQAGVPQDEEIVSVVLRGQLASDGTAGSMRRWALWLRMSPRIT
jgi:hypothetical protein